MPATSLAPPPAQEAHIAIQPSMAEVHVFSWETLLFLSDQHPATQLVFGPPEASDVSIVIAAHHLQYGELSSKPVADSKIGQRILQSFRSLLQGHATLQRTAADGTNLVAHHGLQVYESVRPEREASRLTAQWMDTIDAYNPQEDLELIGQLVGALEKLNKSVVLVLLAGSTSNQPTRQRLPDSLHHVKTVYVSKQSDIKKHVSKLFYPLQQSQSIKSDLKRKWNELSLPAQPSLQTVDIVALVSKIFHYGRSGPDAMSDLSMPLQHTTRLFGCLQASLRNSYKGHSTLHRVLRHSWLGLGKWWLEGFQTSRLGHMLPPFMLSAIPRSVAN